MYLKKWKPVFRDGSGSGFRNSVLLFLSAELECPACQEINKVKSSAHFISGAKHALDRMLIETKVNELGRHWGCIKCGVVSTLPQADRERLKQEVKLLVTDERIRSEVEKFYKQKIAAYAA